MKKYSSTLFVFFFVFITLLLMTSSSRAQNLDDQLFHLINQDLKSPYLDKPMLWTTYLGDPITQGIVVGAFYLAGEKDTSYLLCSALAKSWWTTQLLKNITKRPRPGITHDDVHYVDDYIVKDEESFPSGHTTGAFATATVLSEQYPEYKPHFYTYATLVGISRIYTGVHYSSDVLAGAILGYIIGQSTLKHKNLIIKGNVIEYSIRF